MYTATKGPSQNYVVNFSRILVPSPPPPPFVAASSPRAFPPDPLRRRFVAASLTPPPSPLKYYVREERIRSGTQYLDFEEYMSLHSTWHHHNNV